MSGPFKVRERTDVASGATIALYDTQQHDAAGLFDEYDDRWAVRCDTHASYDTYDELADAEDQFKAESSGWCIECRRDAGLGLTAAQVELLHQMASEDHPALNYVQLIVNPATGPYFARWPNDELVRFVTQRVLPNEKEREIINLLSMVKIERDHGDDEEKALEEMGKLSFLSDEERERNAQLLGELRHWNRLADKLEKEARTDET